VARAMEFRTPGTRTPIRRPVQCQASISWRI
jgi:hypothetical protein